MHAALLIVVVLLALALGMLLERERARRKIDPLGAVAGDFAAMERRLSGIALIERRLGAIEGNLERLPIRPELERVREGIAAVRVELQKRENGGGPHSQRVPLSGRVELEEDDQVATRRFATADLAAAREAS